MTGDALVDQPGRPAHLGLTPIGEVAWRQYVKVHGRVRSIRVRPWADTPTLEVVLVDDTGGITLVFLSRRRIAGIGLGTHLTAEGMVSEGKRRLVILNPVYTLSGAAR